MQNEEPNESQPGGSNRRWAQFRFSVIGTLLAAPPQKGQLQERIKELAAKTWRHPITGQPTTFGFSTIERWYYQALNCGHQDGPVDVLQRKIRADHGRNRSISAKLAEALAAQYRAHPAWSYQLHYDNLAARIEIDPGLAPLPSYASVVRFMKSHGYIKRPRRGPANSPGARVAEHRFEAKEVRSYESEYVNALWHLDFHHGSLRVLLSDGQWAYPLLLGILDDHSRLCCHMQWYLAEGARELCHGLSQAFQKRGLPRAILSDNGSAMIAGETVQGLTRLSVFAENTLPYSPYQNGKQESWWNQIEGRLLPMLEGEAAELTMERLNYVSQAWVEMEYNRKAHRETGQSPLQRFLEGKDVGRPSPAAEQLEQAFTKEVTRTQRRSDGTISLSGVRFEVPSRYGHMERLTVRGASWFPGRAWLCDPKSGAVICRIYPQDKVKNADAKRASRDLVRDLDPDHQPNPGTAPLLEQIIREYVATGLPPAYLPGPEADDEEL